jgi:1,4-dihydroxy-2-naphthoate octaprenyltransferase
VRVLFEMGRPDQVLLIALVYVYGVVVAVNDGAVPVLRDVVVSFLAFLPVVLAVHYANEYADYETDLRADRTPFSGGSGALARTDRPRSLPRRAAVASGVVAVPALALALVTDALGFSAFGLAIAIGLLGVEYSVGPLALVRRGFGEVANALLGGLLLPAYGYLVAGETPSGSVLLVCLPFTFLVFANLLTTHWPDRVPDARVGKETLVVRWNRQKLRRTYWLVVAFAYGSLVVLGFTGVVPALAAALGLVSLPLSVWGGVRYTRRRSPFPAVAAMVSFAATQTLAWAWIPLAAT